MSVVLREAPMSVVLREARLARREIRQGRFQRAMALVTAFAALVSGLEAYTQHLRGAFGHWLIGEAGAVLYLAGGRRVHCFCVTPTDKELPPSDRIAHLLLALRSDEIGFATVANHAFSGAAWRVRRRLPKQMRPAFDRAS
jgi:hypothetical protein